MFIKETRFYLINSLKDKRENVSEGFDNILIVRVLPKEGNHLSEEGDGHRCKGKEGPISKRQIDNNGKDIPKGGREGCGEWQTVDIRHSGPTASSPFLSPHSVLKSSLAYLASCVSLYIRKAFSHHLCCEDFGFYGSDFSLQTNRLDLRLWLSFPYN